VVVLTGGVIASLLIAIGFAVVVDVARQRFRTQSEIEAFWGTPVLIEIPRILTDSDVAVQRKKKFLFAAYSAGTTAYCVCL